MTARLSILVVLLVGTSASAEPATATKADKAAAKADKAAAKAATKAEKAARLERAVADARAALPADLVAMTNEPIMGKSDRIDGEDPHGLVAFTFDDGPNPATSPEVIAALEKYDIPATFFIVTQRIDGKHGEKAREVLARELAEGFTVGSHSVTHANLKHADAAKLAKEVDASLRTLSPEAKRPIGLFRPPYGSMSPLGRIHLKALGLTEVFWSVDTLDWKAKDADKLRAKVHQMIIKQNGGVVLMHDIKPITAKIIASVFDDLEAENCRRIAAKQDPITPVSLHYFLHDGGKPRAIPEDVKARTATYLAKLPGRCAARPKTVAPAADPMPTEAKPIH
ncbi:MAG TPA: polysaccharide deacetylase family protein [Kofleriaceae bacterium]